MLFFIEGFPKVRYFTVDECFTILVMDLLGPSLEKVFESCKRQFSIRSISIIGCQMVNLVFPFFFNLRFLYSYINERIFSLSYLKKN